MKFSEMKYERLDISAACAQIKALCAQFRAADSAAAQMAVYREISEIQKQSATMYSLCYIRHSVDTRDSFYDAENDYYDENLPLIHLAMTDFYRDAVQSKFRPELERELGTLWFQNAEMQIKGLDERIVAQVQAENALISEYGKLIASADLEFEGQHVNLAQLRAWMVSPDREVRRRAYAKRTEFFTANEAKLDEIFDKLVKLRDEQAKTLGYRNYTELGYVRMTRNSYTREDVERFREQVKRVIVPLAERLHEERRRNLGVERLYHYDEDVFYAAGNPKPHGTPELMFDSGKRMYAELSDETREFFDFMLENELFDVMAKAGKEGGGYCTSLPGYRAPFVFANFNGTSDDVDTLTHECGHAFNYYLSRDIPILEYQESTMDVAEIHSMSMEFFTGKWMHLFFGEDTARYRRQHLEAAVMFLPYGCMVDEFQHEVYDHPEMTPAERKATWLRLEKEYQPHFDYDGDPFFGAGGRWQRQSHIYEVPFYYIDYCLAQTCALAFRIAMERDFADAWERYCALSRKAGTERFTDLVTGAGLKSPFAPGCMEEIAAGIEAILAD